MELRCRRSVLQASHLACRRIALVREASSCCLAANAPRPPRPSSRIAPSNPPSRAVTRRSIQGHDMTLRPAPPPAPPRAAPFTFLQYFHSGVVVASLGSGRGLGAWRARPTAWHCRTAGQPDTARALCALCAGARPGPSPWARPRRLCGATARRSPPRPAHPDPGCVSARGSAAALRNPNPAHANEAKVRPARPAPPTPEGHSMGTGSAVASRRRRVSQRQPGSVSRPAPSSPMPRRPVGKESFSHYRPRRRPASPAPRAPPRTGRGHWSPSQAERSARDSARPGLARHFRRGLAGWRGSDWPAGPAGPGGPGCPGGS